jgi:hypothetical protein
MARNGVVIGALGHADRGVVDPGGLLTPCGQAWSIDWWVQSGNAWHLASRGAVVRQRLVGHAPVVETAMRVGGGDVVCTAYGVPGGGAVVDVTNQTPMPIAVALVVGPARPDAAGVETIAWDGQRGVCVDGRPAVLFARVPAGAAGRSWEEEELLVRLESSDASWRTVRCARRRAQAAFVFPLPRTTSARAVVALGADPVRLPSSVPGPAEVARGWDRLVASALAVDLPAQRLGDAVEVCRRRLLLAQDAAPPARAVATAAQWGLVAPSSAPKRRGRRRVPRPSGPGPAISHRSGGLDPRATLERAVFELAEGEADGLVRLRWALEVATDAWTWPTVIDPGHATGTEDDILVTAAFLDAVRELLVAERRHGVALCPHWPEEWGRAGLDVRRVPTSGGLLSFAIRWHGDRPAVLWELEGPAVRFTAPGLDPAWSATASSGEALLAPRSRIASA